MRHHHAQRGQVGTAVGVHHALWPARGARGVVDGDGGIFILHAINQFRFFLVFDASKKIIKRNNRTLIWMFRLRLRTIGIVDEHEGLHQPGAAQGPPAGQDEFLFSEENVDAGVIADVTDFRGREPGVDRHQHSASQWNRELSQQRFIAVGSQHSHSLAGLQAPAEQSPGHHLCVPFHVREGDSAWPIDARGSLWVRGGAALEEAQRCERGIESGKHGGFLKSGS